MAFPSSFLETLRERVPLSGIVGARVRLTRAGREFKACCPFHNEKSPSFTVNDDKGFYHCFGCGAHGDVISFLMQHDNLPFLDTVKFLAEQAGVPVPDQPREETVDKSLYDAVAFAASWYHRYLLEAPEAEAARAYLKQRGLTREIAARWQLGYAPSDGQKFIAAVKAQGFSEGQLQACGLIKAREDGKAVYSFFRERILFPVADTKGRIVAFGGRILEGDGPKYLNSADHALFHKGALLYNYSSAKEAVRQGQRFIVVEGYLDVITLAEAGFTGAVAPLGTALTEQQISLLWRAGAKASPDPVLCFDGDSAGERAAVRSLARVLPQIGPGKTVEIAALPAGEDPDDCIRKGGAARFAGVLQLAQPLVEYLWHSHNVLYPGQTPEQRAQREQALQQLVATIADPTTQNYYRQELKNRLYWQGRQQGRPQAGGKPATRPALAARPNIGQSQSAQHRDAVILATIINYPELIGALNDRLQRYHPAESQAQQLLDKILECFELQGESTLDAPQLNRYLNEAGFGSYLGQLLSLVTYRHAAFARPGQSLVEARTGLTHALDLALLPQLRVEQAAAASDLAHAWSDASLARLQSLQAIQAALLDLPDGENRQPALNNVKQ